MLTRAGRVICCVSIKGSNFVTRKQCSPFVDVDDARGLILDRCPIRHVSSLMTTGEAAIQAASSTEDVSKLQSDSLPFVHNTQL